MTNKELFTKIDEALLGLEKPSEFFEKNWNELFENSEVFRFLSELKETEQNLVHHPEGNVYNHTMLVIDAGAKILDRVENKSAFMWGLLLHDIGKIKTTKERNGKITSYEHDIVGRVEAKKVLEKFDFIDEKFKDEVLNIVEYHMQPSFIVKNMKDLAKRDEVIKNIDINLLCNVFYCDKSGRTGVDVGSVEKSVEKFRAMMTK